MEDGNFKSISTSKPQVMSSFWKNKPLEKVIRYPIEYHQIHQEKVKPSKRLEIQEANDLFFVTNETSSLTAFYIYFGIGIFALFFIWITASQKTVVKKLYLSTLYLYHFC